MRFGLIKTVKIQYKNVIYNIEIKKLIFIMRKLTNNPNFEFKNEKEIDEMMERFNLYDEYFLKNVNKIEL